MTIASIPDHSSLASNTITPFRRRAGPWRVALLGAGYIAEWHAKAIQQLKDVRLVAVCDRVATKAEACARTFGIPRAHTNIEKLLQAGDLDAVHVLLPPDQHFGAAKTILDAGINVFLEKPMCASAEECRALEAHAASLGLRVAVGHNFLFSKVYEQLRNAVHGGLLGPLDHVTVTWNKELGQSISGPFDIWMLREPQNIMLEIGSHSVAHMVDLMGQPDEMQVQATNPITLPTGQSFYRRWCVNAYQGKVATELRFSFVPGFSEHCVHVRGALGTATADLERNTFILRRHTSFGVDLDRYFMLRNEGRGLCRQGWHNLRDYAMSKLKMSRNGSAFGSSIARCMHAFYNSIGKISEPRVASTMGSTVIDICQRIGKEVEIQRKFVRPSQITKSRQTGLSNVAETLVLGATGFIGQELVRQLTAKGHAVRLLVRSPGKLSQDLLGPLTEIMRGDLTESADLDRAMAGMSCVYHLARPMVKTWDDYKRYDIDVTRQIAEKCLRLDVKRLVYTGTIDSYYAGSRAGVITEKTPLDRRIEHRNLYARSKAESERILMQMNREHALPVVIARPGIVIGRGSSPFHWGVGMWQHGFVCQVWGSGNNKLPLVLVEDVARGLLALLDAKNVEGQTFNFAADPCLSAQEYLDELESAGGLKLPRSAVSIRHFYATDMLKWFVKSLVRHPGRRLPSYRDWESRTQRALFDCSKAKTQLAWKPISDRATMVKRGIAEPLAELLN